MSYKNKRIIAVIPARGGSKGIHRKNIYPLNGKPLIYWTINEAKKSKLLDRIICSTDNQEIALLARRYGAEVPFLRPSKLALDKTPDLPVFNHALRWLRDNEGYKPDIIVHLRVTSPLRQSLHIDEAVKLLVHDNNADSVRSVCIPNENPYKMWVNKGKYLKPLLKLKGLKEPYNSARQLLPKVYWQTGLVDVTRYETIMNKHSMTGKNILPYIIDEKYSIDIESVIGIKIAELIMRNSKSSKLA